MATLPDSDERASPPMSGASSPRAFGLMLSLVVLLVSLRPLLHHAAPRVWGIGAALLALLAAIWIPRIYALPTRAWLRFGELLSHIVSPFAMGILFFCIFSPLGWLYRVTGRNPLRLGYDATASTYWLTRDPPGPSGDSLRNQF